MRSLKRKVRGAQKFRGPIKSAKLEISFGYVKKKSKILIKIATKIVKMTCIICHSVIDCRRSVEMNRE